MEHSHGPGQADGYGVSGEVPHSNPAPHRSRGPLWLIERAIHRGLLRVVLAAVNQPRLALLICGTILAVCIGLAMARLPISTDQNELFSANVKFFSEWLDFDRKFPENQALYLIVLPHDPHADIPTARWTGLADAIGDRLKSIPKYVTRYETRIPLDELGSQGILFQDPKELKKDLDEIRPFAPLAKLVAEKPNGLTGLLGSTPLERFLGGLNTQPVDPRESTFLRPLAESLVAAASHPDKPLGRGAVPDLRGADLSPRALGYYYERNDDPKDPRKYLLLVRVYPRDDFSRLTAVSETVAAIRAAAHDAAGDYPEFTVGATGRPALDADEMEQTDRDSREAEICAGIAVFIGLAFMLRSLWLALVAEIALGVGIGWTFGWATITVGKLNLLSIVFLIALIGIGMDYLVQILMRYRREREMHARATVIWTAVFRHVGPPINTACLGAAGAFFTSTLTDFRGAAELGIIAGGGLLLCLTAGYTALPAILTLFPGRVKAGVAGPRAVERTLPSSIQPTRGPRWLITPALWIALLVVGVVTLAPRTHFDPGLLNLQDPKAESVKLVNKLQTWSAAVLSPDLTMLRKVRGALKDAPTAASTDSILNAYDNEAFCQDPKNALPAIAWTEPPTIEPANLTTIAGRAGTLADHIGAKDPTGAALRQFSDLLAHTAGPDARKQIAQRLTEWQSDFIEQLRLLLGQFHPLPLDLSRVPAGLLSHYRSDEKTGSPVYALYVNPKENLWDQKALGRFVNDIEPRVASVPGAPDVTGITSDIYHSTAYIQRAFFKATAYALALIFVLVLLDLRRVGQTLLAVSVLGLGLPMLVALMGLFNSSWNFANFFALPILIGAGHEYGVFLVHRYREACKDPRRAWRRWDVSDGALLLCAYVTSSSFGFFWALAKHRGLKSLGLVMALGTACIYLSAVLVLRPILLWRLERNGSSGTNGCGSSE